MHDKLISLETYFLAKGKGLDIPAKTTQSLLQKILRDQYGIHIELRIDGWGSDDKVMDDFLCYRGFVWRVGHPRPTSNEDFGAADYEGILEVALREALVYVNLDKQIPT